MAEYKTDLEDIFFNLIDAYSVQKNKSGLDEASIREIISEFDRFIGKEIYPSRMLGDTQGLKYDDGEVTVPDAFLNAKEQYYANGWFGLGCDESLGGMPAPQSVTAACASIVIGANVAFSMYPGLSKGAFNVIEAFGSEKQKARFLEHFISGKFGGTMCLTEANAGSDVGNGSTTATPAQNGLYSIKGVKIFISSGENNLYENNVHLVLARTPGAPKGVKGLSLFIVPKFLVDENGESGAFNNIKCTKIEEKMGIHGSATSELTFGHGGECLGELIGKENDGMRAMFLMMNEARLHCGIQGQAQAALAYELSKQYAKERVQFGKEIIHHPDVKRTLLYMRACTRGMRALSLYTANLLDLEHEDKSLSKEVALLTPICKAYMSDEGFNITVDAMQIHGGYGYCQEYGIEQFVRDSKIASIYEGTNGIQAIDFIMRKILGDKGEQFMALGQKISATMKNVEAQEYAHELAMMGKSMEMSEKILNKFAILATKGDIDTVLTFATAFLRYCGNIAIAWQLLAHACKAKQLMAESTSNDFYQEKICDFKIFCQFKLTENIGIANSILNFDEGLMSYNL
ncbi:MAG: acyl-CoA dehydrogenase [Bdellovibrionota bacterium]